jgi:hypothetical protein
LSRAAWRIGHLTNPYAEVGGRVNFAVSFAARHRNPPLHDQRCPGTFDRLVVTTATPGRRVVGAKGEPSLSALSAPSGIRDVRSWDDVKLPSVRVDRLTRWSKPGLLCVGGVGINLAIQDAVATANLLAVKLRDDGVTEDDLDAVRRRRLWPTKATQAAQVAMQDNVLVPVMRGGAAADLRVPLPMRVLTALPPLQRLLARLIGMGIRPEHVRSPSA